MHGLPGGDATRWKRRSAKDLENSVGVLLAVEPRVMNQHLAVRVSARTVVRVHCQGVFTQLTSRRKASSFAMINGLPTGEGNAKTPPVLRSMPPTVSKAARMS